MNPRLEFSLVGRALLVPVFFLAVEVPLAVAKGLWPHWLDIKFISGLDLVGMTEFTYVSVIGVIGYHKGIAWLACGCSAMVVMAVIMLLQIQIPRLILG